MLFITIRKGQKCIREGNYCNKENNHEGTHVTNDNHYESDQVTIAFEDTEELQELQPHEEYTYSLYCTLRVRLNR